MAGLGSHPIRPATGAERTYPGQVSGDGDGGLRSVLRRLTRSQTQADAVEEQERSRRLGGTPCSELTGRRRVRLAGSLRSVTLRPRAGVPALEAELFDGTGSVVLIWLGRREIVGIDAGRQVRVEGLVSCSEGRKVMYNPTYELTAGSSA